LELQAAHYRVPVRLDLQLVRDAGATDEASVKGGPALVIHNQQAADVGKLVFVNDVNSISGEAWFHLYVITNGKQSKSASSEG